MNRPLTSLPQSGSRRAEPQQVEPEGSSRAAVHVRVASTLEEFAALAPPWNRLHAEGSVASVFTSWMWQFNWWQVYGRGQPLRLLVAYADAEVIGILALYVQSVSILGLPVRLLRFVGTGGDTSPDDLGPVLEPRQAHVAAQELARAALALRDADMLLLTDLSPECTLRRAVESEARRDGRPVVSSLSERIALIRFPGSWDDYLQALSSHHRLGLRYKRRKLAKSHATRFFVWSDPARIDAALERLAELHWRRWQSRGKSHSFRSAEYLEFHRRVMKGCLLRGWLRLYCLEVDGEIAAMAYCYRFRNAVYCMQQGFDPAKGKLKLGSVLLGYALEHAIGEGNRVFDFLRGDHDYKEHLASDHRETVTVCVFRATPGALAYRVRRVWLPVAKARLLRRPPPKLRV